MASLSGTTSRGTPYLTPTDPPDLPAVSKALAQVVDTAAASAEAAAASAAATASAAAVPLRRVYTANATWTKPTAANFLGAWVYVCGGGAGAPAAGNGWSPGGGAGVRMWLAASEMPATVAVTVGGPAAPNTTSSPRPGNPSSFGSLVYAAGGSVGNLTVALAGPGVAANYASEVSGPTNAGTPFALFAGGMGGSTAAGGASLYGGGAGGGGAGGVAGRGGMQHIAGSNSNWVIGSGGTSAAPSGVSGVSRSGTERGGDGGGAAYSLAAGATGDGGNGGIPGGGGGCAAPGRTPGTGARGEVIVTEVYGTSGTGS